MNEKREEFLERIEVKKSKYFYAPRRTTLPNDVVIKIHEKYSKLGKQSKKNIGKEPGE